MTLSKHIKSRVPKGGHKLEIRSSISRAFRLLPPPLQLCLPVLLCGPFLTTTLIWSCIFGLKGRNLAEPIEAGVSALGLIETVSVSEFTSSSVRKVWFFMSCLLSFNNRTTPVLKNEKAKERKNISPFLCFRGVRLWGDGWKRPLELGLNDWIWNWDLLAARLSDFCHQIVEVFLSCKIRNLAYSLLVIWLNEIIWPEWQRDFDCKEAELTDDEAGILNSLMTGCGLI